VYQFLPVNYILGHQIPQILPIFLTLFFSNRIKTKTNACQAFQLTECLKEKVADYQMQLAALDKSEGPPTQ